jgi:predicted Zn finger-like uncharacterized protein
MSLITRCPACGTQFRVVADQLKISEGWVRCGKCREVFDAPVNMASDVQGVPKPLPPRVSSERTIQQQTGNSDADDLEIAIRRAAVNDVPAPKKKKQDFSSSDWINSVNPPAPYEDSYSSADNPPSLMPQDFTEEELSSSDLAPLFAQSSLEQPAMGTPSFVRQARRAQRWRAPWVKASLLALVLLLTTALGLQVALQERDRIAAAQPLALPWLEQLCLIAGCTVGPLKQIESVQVDASSFNKLRTEGKYDFYKIALNLKNSGTLAVAVPHIELSLNDSQDQPVLRRVLNPADLGVSQSSLAPAAELAGATTVQIDSTQLAGARIAGYRMLAFYP